MSERCCPHHRRTGPFAKIGFYGWRQFRDRREDANMHMVRKFYANILLNQPRGHLWVLEIEVPYDVATIKSMFNIPEMEGETHVVS